MTGWQPIESAPKDGTTFLLFSPDADQDSRPNGRMIGSWRDDDDYPDGGAWWERDDAAWPIDADPSHWMPLPEPPSVPGER